MPEAGRGAETPTAPADSKGPGLVALRPKWGPEHNGPSLSGVRGDLGWGRVVWRASCGTWGRRQALPLQPREGEAVSGSPASHLGPCAACLRCPGVGWLQNWMNGICRLAGLSKKKSQSQKILRILKKPTKYVLLQMPKMSSGLLWI